MKYDPDQSYYIEDNTEAIRLLTDQNVLTLMAPPEPNQNVGYHCYDSGTHWCLACHYVGFDDDNDNGYCITMLSKTKASSTDASVFFAKLIKGMAHENLTFKPFTKQPQSNN